MPSEVITKTQHSLYESSLQAEISSTDTNIQPVSTGTFQDGDVVYFSLEPKTTRKELCKGTWSAANSRFESCLRGLRLWGADTEVTANKSKHSKGAKIVVSDQHNWHQEVKDAVNNIAIHPQVADVASLPGSGMAQYDVRFVRDVAKWYYYDGASWSEITTGTIAKATTTTAGSVKISDAMADPVAVVTDNSDRLLSTADYTDLTDAGDSALHYHATDRARANHTGTQAASTISDFTEATQDAMNTALTGGTLTAIDVTYQDASDNYDIAVKYDDATIGVNGSNQIEVKADGINDTHIDWGSGANQVNLDDVPDGSSYIRIPATGATNSHIAAAAAIDWTKISKTGSNLTDLATRQHAGLSDILGSGAYHLTSTEQSNITSHHAEMASFFNTTDITGAEAEELTDGSETTKHKHALPSVEVGNGTRTTVEGSGAENVVIGFIPSVVWITATQVGNGGSISWGHSDFSNTKVIDTYNQSAYSEYVDTYIIYLRGVSSSTLKWRATIATYDSGGDKGFTLSFTALNTPTNDVQYIYTAIR